MKMYKKKRGVFLVLILLVLSSFVFAEIVSLDTSDRKPMISVTFKEPSDISAMSFINSNGDNFPLLVFHDEGFETYRFSPDSILDLGSYVMDIDAVDKLGNEPADGQPAYSIELEIVPLDIELIMPRFGYAITDPFDLVVETEIDAECKWSRLDLTPFDSNFMNIFQRTGGQLHQYSSFSDTGGISQTVFVTCNDTYGFLTTKRFELNVLLEKPVIDSITAYPNPVVSEPRSSRLVVVTDVATLCKHSFSSTNYGEMTSEFEPFDQKNKTTFTTNHVFETGVLEDDTDYNYQVVCENYGGALTDMKNVLVKVDFAAALTMTLGTPLYSSTSPIMLNVTTNRQATCLYNAPDEPRSSFDQGLTYQTYEHTVLLADTNEDGTYVYTVTCHASGLNNTQFKLIEEFSLVVDTTSPILNDIIVNDVVCQRSNDEFGFNVEFVGEDNESGIEYYEYIVREGNMESSKAMTDLLIATTNEIEIDEGLDGDDLNLTLNRKYYIFVRAMNRAGKWSSKVVSEGIIAQIAESEKCKEKNPPLISVVEKKQGSKFNISLVCTDNVGVDGKVPSGCNYQSIKYGLSEDQEFCYNMQNTYSSSFEVDKPIWLCWSGKDHANNEVTGDKFVGSCDDTFDSDDDGIIDCIDNCINAPNSDQEDEDNDGIGDACEAGSREGCVIDNDEDGFGLGCYGGPDCDDTNFNIHKDCLSGCMQDSDGDAYGIKCTLGNDCDDTDATVHNTCPNGCIQDNDGDEYGLGCNNGLDCNDANPEFTDDCENNCRSDLDGDGYGLGCDNGPDCDESSYIFNFRCEHTTCKLDSDGDGYGMGCDIGPDCDDTNPTRHNDCPSGCILDNDGDDYGLGCNLGGDCNDQEPSLTNDCTNNCVQDSDGDGYGEGCDNGWDCNDIDFSAQTGCESGCIQDTDGDLMGLGCNLGSDCDDYTILTTTGCIDSCTFDSDCDGMDDEWEIENGLDPNKNDALGDLDGDGQTNLDEYRNGREANFNEEENDRDQDGMDDDWERQFGLDPNDPLDGAYDLDSDGLTNLEEYIHSSSGEYSGQLNPNEADTDGDTYDDGREVNGGFDPTDANSHPQPVLGFVLLIIGFIVLLSGAGYLGYKKYMKYQNKPHAVSRDPVKTSFRSAPVEAKSKSTTPGDHEAHKRFMERLRAKESDLDKVFGAFDGKKKSGFKPKNVSKGKIDKKGSGFKGMSEGRIKPYNRNAADIYKDIIKEKPKKEVSFFDRLRGLGKKDNFSKLDAMGGSSSKLSELTKTESEFDKLQKFTKNKRNIVKEKHKNKEIERLRNIKSGTGKSSFAELAKIRKKKVDSITKLKKMVKNK